MEPNTNEATAPKRLKTGGRKPLIIIGVIAAVLLAAYAAIVFFACALTLRARLRGLPRASIVESIREL